jgi:uncharacterized membrane protein YfcA
VITIIALIVVGLLAGVMSAALGVGGGIVYVPALVALFGFAQHEAQGTSLAVIVPTMIVAGFVHGRAKRVDWNLVLPLALASLVGGFFGARTALALDAVLLRRMFAVLLILASLRMLAKTRRAGYEPADPVIEP